MELLLDEDRDSNEPSGAILQFGGETDVPASVGELTDLQLDLQRRLVRESLLLRPA